MSRVMKNLLAHQAGFTLVEVLVSLSILSIILGTLGTAFFQSISTQRTIVDDGFATNEARKGLSWFAPDVRMAQYAEIDTDENVLTLSWTDEFGYAFDGNPPCYSSEYRLNGDTLQRTIGDGENESTHTVARRVRSVAFPTPTPGPGNVTTVTIELEVETGGNATETLSMTAAMMSKAKESSPCEE